MGLLDRIRERTGSDLSDSELQAMIDGITAELDARLGPAGAIAVEIGDATDPYTANGRTLRLARPIDVAAAVTVVEIDPGNSGAAADSVTLDPADYQILHGGRTLKRRTTGPNGRSYWAPEVQVTYTPLGSAALREEAVIKLMQLDLTYRGGLKSERAGDYSFTLSGDPVADREAILRGLQAAQPMVMA